MLWIEYRQNEDTPKKLYYCSYQADEDHYGRTPLMLWIEHRQNEKIPKKLFYYDC